MIVGTGLVARGKRIHIPGLNIVNYLDDPRLRLKMGEDGQLRPRGEPIDTVVLHSTRGAPDSDDPREQVLIPGVGPSSRAGYEVVEDWNHDHRCAGAHFVDDFDGTVYQLADIDLEETYSATTTNPRSISIEMRQGRNCEFYSAQMSATGGLADALCTYERIPRFIPDVYRGALTFLAAGGHGFRGVFGHRDQTHRRGRGDPGDLVMAELGARGFQRVNLLAREDWRITKRLQQMAGVTVDGVYGPETFAALEALGYRYGQHTFPPDEPRAA